MAMRRPAEVFPPGEFLREELEARGWTQADLADILGRPYPVVNEIVAGRRGISPETARGLAAALGTSAELWMNLEAAYQLWRAGGDDGGVVSRRARLYSLAPMKDMLRRGWIEPSDSIDVLEKRVLSFLEISSVDDQPRFPAHAARKSTSYGSCTPAQTAWLFRARQLARAVHVAPFSRENCGQALDRLRLLLHVPQEARHVSRVLSDAGIRLVIVQPLPAARIDGACFWLDASSPVIVLSLRFDRIDYFWFTLMHELAHVFRGEAVIDFDLDATPDSTELPEEEQFANRFAADQLIQRQQLDSFIARVRPLYSARRIEAFAQLMKVHPGIAVGQLQHRKEVAWSSFKKLLVPIREFITASSLTDGWGSVLPAVL